MSAEPTRIQTILVVDDNLANRQVAAGHLVAAGYAVELAETGEQGVAKFKERTPDLVLLDILMPGIDGFETCRQLKALVAGRATRRSYSSPRSPTSDRTTRRSSRAPTISWASRSIAPSC